MRTNVMISSVYLDILSMPKIIYYYDFSTTKLIRTDHRIV